MIVHAQDQAARHHRRGTLLSQSFHRWSMITAIVSGAAPSRGSNSEHCGVSPPATALLLVRFRSSRQTAGLSPCTSLTHNTQTEGRHRARAVPEPVAPSVRATRLDRAQPPATLSSDILIHMVFRASWSAQRVTGGRPDASVSVCRDGITSLSRSRLPRVAWPRAHERALHGPDRCASMCCGPSTQAISLVTTRRDLP